MKMLGYKRLYGSVTEGDDNVCIEGGHQVSDVTSLMSVVSVTLSCTENIARFLRGSLQRFRKNHLSQHADFLTLFFILRTFSHPTMINVATLFIDNCINTAVYVSRTSIFSTYSLSFKNP